LGAVLNSIVDGVIVVDPELRLLMINPVAADIFGLSYPQAHSPSVNDSIDHTPLLGVLRQALKQTTASDAGDIIVEEEITARPISTGKPTIFQALATALVSEQDAPHGVVVVLRDMTRQKELEESKTNFISMLSHELRTPLTAIRGFVELLLSKDAGELAPKQLEYLDIVFNQSEHLQSLINALLEYAEMEASETALHLHPLSLKELVQMVLGQIEPLADQRGVNLHAHLPPEVAPIYADGERLQRVLLNLLDNALKFTPERGHVTITVSDQGPEVRVCVADTGIGIPPAERERVFDRFYQIDSSSTRQHGGTGLGLALCKHIVELHHGRIWVEHSNEGSEADSDVGSRFCFTIPRGLAQRTDP
jgi:two-component system phosphate regulon sensor histidine kinase PhoR